jgi:hypothetical protein
VVWNRDVREEAGEIQEHVGAKALFAAGAPADVFVASEGERREESLGIRDFAGVAAEGERVVVAIPAGQIGNEQPIEIVTERWYSEELHTVVESVRRDPRVGETRFRLKELRLGEPDPALFEVPDGWTVEQGEGPETLVIHEQGEEPEADR